LAIAYSLMALPDKHNRNHNYLRISLTEKCNLRCAYCMPAEGIPLLPSAKLMQADEVFAIAKTFVSLGVDKIRLTGGEPLVRKDFDVILRNLASLPVELAISTNGILVDKHVALFKETGLQKINLSIDSLQPEKFAQITRRNDFEKVMRNLDLLLENNFNIKLNVVLMRGFNDDEIIDFINFTKTRKVAVRFIEFMPFGGNDWKADKMLSLEEILEKAKNAFGEKLITLKNHENDTAKNFKISGYAGSWGVISTVTSPFCAGCNRLRLTADGKIKNCLFSNQEMDLLSALRENKPLENLVKLAVYDKHAIRAGMDTPEKFADKNLNQDNRSMIAIGG